MHDIERLKEEVLSKTISGNAILFTGAGFSRDCHNIMGENPPDAMNLAYKISDLAGIRRTTNLKYASDKCIERDCTELIEKLKQWFMLKEVSPDTETILSIKWRRLYTTNYDTGLELGLTKNGKTHKSLCADSEFARNVNGENLCIHINGLIETLDEEKLEKDFRLSDSSYVASALDSVTRRKWNSFFKRDLENASALIFVGYSLYDFEIEKLLFENPAFKKKTYFICREDIFEDENSEDCDRLSKYGRVLNIAKTGFAQLIVQNNAAFFESKIILTDFIEFSDSLRMPEEMINDTKAMDALIFGTDAQKLAVSAVYSENADVTPRYFVKRAKSIRVVIEQLEAGKHVFISAECGNGKTCLLYQVAAQLNLNSEKVYFLSEGYKGDPNQLAELSRGAGVKYVVVDRCACNADFLTALLESPYKNIRLICADRPARLNTLFVQLNADNLCNNCVLLDGLDCFNEDETKAFLFLIDSLGQWKELAGGGSVEKIKHLEGEENCIRLAPALLKLLNAKQIKDRLSSILKSLLKQNLDRKKTIFAMCYLSITGAALDDANVYEVADCSEIFSVSFTGTSEFKQLFQKQYGIYSLSYSFAQYVLRESGYFTGIEISGYLLDIVNRLGNTNASSSLHGIVRDSLRFHVIESIVPNMDKIMVMQNYYENLKSLEAFGHRLIHDPNYWMQYAMTKMMCFRYEEAQTYLEQAYGKAEYLKKKSINGAYDTHKIDNQQARLYLLRAQDRNCLDSATIYDYFIKADSKLHAVPVDRFLMHRIPDMINILKEKSSVLSKKHLPLIKSTIVQYRDKLEDAIRSGKCTDVSSGAFMHLSNSLDFLLENLTNES